MYIVVHWVYMPFNNLVKVWVLLVSVLIQNSVNIKNLVWHFSGNILSIAFFNFSGISVTKELSATTRMVLDSARTVVIWIVSMAVGWQAFAVKSFFVQLAGFILLICGMCIYNDIIFAPVLRSRGCLKPRQESQDGLSVDEPGEFYCCYKFYSFRILKLLTETTSIVYNAGLPRVREKSGNNFLSRPGSFQRFFKKCFCKMSGKSQGIFRKIPT